MPLTRREFLKTTGLVAAGVGTAGVAADRIISYVHQPENLTPGVSFWYATSCRECPAGCGMVVRCREGHAVKCEGNPVHPVNRGALCARGQAALQGLYDPDRVPGPRRRGDSGDWEPASWDDALNVAARSIQGSRGVALVSDLQNGSLEALMRAWLAAFGSDRLLICEPINYEAVRAANGGVVPHYAIAESDCIVSFACDFLDTWVSPVEYATSFASARQVRDGKRTPLIYIGPRVSATAAMADIRLLAPPEAAGEIASALVDGGDLQSLARKHDFDPAALQQARMALATAARPIALPGPDGDCARAAATLNAARKTSLIDLGRPHAVSSIATREAVSDFIGAMESGAIDFLAIHGANPAFSLQDPERFSKAVGKVRTVISLSSYSDETSLHANWILPSNTPLESWGDYFPYPDVGNLMQPVMGTVFDTRHAGDTLMAIAERAGIDPHKQFGASDFYGYLRKRWGQPAPAGSGPEASSPEWESLLQRGGSWTESARQSVNARPSATPEAAQPADSPAPSDKLSLWAFPHIYYYDGRGANRRWLQEMPEPLTKAVWSSWAEIHPETARALGVATDDIVEIAADGTSIRVPAYVWDGVAKNTVAVPIGEGHTHFGRFANGVGVNVYPLLGAAGPYVTVSRTGGSKWITRIKGSTDQHGRRIVQTARLGEQFSREEPITMPLPSGYTRRDFYPPHKYARHRWAMVVDLDKCIGCHACVTACYAENNVGAVGPDGIWSRREMSWIRIDRYIDWNEKSAPVLFQPMLCQHCDAAPCEPVCPVYASSHSDEGLNMQVYNRCVGTRYCSHNCPYKVRRFNWADYQWPEPLNWQLNPDVTVRCRGVMEKCTFCIQRIREAEITAKQEGRPVRDGEIMPACVQTCPTKVFTFGDLMDSKSEVAQIVNEDPRAYQVLRELNTKPAIIYLKRVIGGPA